VEVEVAIVVVAIAVVLAIPEVAMAADSVAVMVVGATGLVGREVLAVLLADKRYSKVHSVGRRKLAADDPASAHPKLVQHVVDYKAAATLAALPAVDQIYIALGTTIKVAGSQAAFRAVDFDAVVAIARAALAAGASKAGVVSAMGADPKSAIFYSRVKGEMEEALAHIGFKNLVIARPSMLAGDRLALNQAERRGERLALALTRAIRPLIPANYRSIQARDVACALVEALNSTQSGVRRLLSGEMQGASTR
jgi:uncharacterized protein YbjT (DUF2867 family)